MKLHGRYSLAKVLPFFRRLFPVPLLKQMQVDCLPPGNFQRVAQPARLVEALAAAIILRLSSQQEIVRSCPALGLRSHSSLGYDLDRPWFQVLTAELNAYRRQVYPTYEAHVRLHPRILIDTMPVLMPITQRGKCDKFNNVAKGCGVMCGFNLDAQQGQSPVDILRIMPGGWNDAYRVRSVELTPNGPIYIADRGFFSRETLHLWREQQVHFLVRAKKANLRYSIVRSLKQPPVTVGKIRVESDEIILLGKPGAKFRCEVRLIKGWLNEKEDLWLTSDQYDATPEQLFSDYLQRGQIEVYHRFVKQSLCMAHLYSFDQTGIESQIQLTVLLANLLFLSAPGDPQTANSVIKIIDQQLKKLRDELGLSKPWYRNTVAQRRNKPLHNRRQLKRRTPTVQPETNL